MLVCDMCGKTISAEERLSIFHSVIRSKNGTYGKNNIILGPQEYGDVCSDECTIKFHAGQRFIQVDVVVS